MGKLLLLTILVLLTILLLFHMRFELRSLRLQIKALNWVDTSWTLYLILSILGSQETNDNDI